MRTVEIEDHDTTVKALNEHLRIDPAKTAIVTVDMHRGHLDPVEATLPVAVEEGQRVCRHAHELLTFARAQGISVIHVIAVFRESEADKINPRIGAARVVLSRGAPKTEAQRRGVMHNLKGSIQTELMPEIGPDKNDYVIDTKKTFSIFQGTDLEHLLRIVLGVDTVVLMGINTNTCVLCGAFESFNLGYKTVVISDCVASMYGQDLHALGLENIGRCLGWVLTADEFKGKIRAYQKESF
ncbi:MAG TPA: cysteine hydrolase [Thermodesulfobacteriota bacterium]|nr:cysteine hydrolase [Thermodesulfobacteriota bacterium]